ncbi:uncharacterized protein [Oscarella lobularis]|uniref:uncharacterized protein isoform X2 n=1 Tax=Oscarella lobularis TaxID=121494 RepID=UPI0033135E34
MFWLSRPLTLRDHPFGRAQNAHGRRLGHERSNRVGHPVSTTMEDLEITADGVHKASVAIGLIKKKNFIWDEIISCVGLVLLSLLSSALGETFLGGDGTTTACLTPNFTRPQVHFVNRFCANASIQGLKLAPLFFLGELTLLVGAHVVWENYAGSRVQHFFSMVAQIGRQRVPSNGLFDVDSREIVRRLRADYDDPSQVQVCRRYWIKLVVQLLACAMWIAITTAVYFRENFFGETLAECRLDENSLERRWFREQLVPLCPDSNSTLCGVEGPVAVLCKSSFYLVTFSFWVINCVLLLVAAAMSAWGLVWYCCRSHWKELDYEGKADFLYTFSLNREKYYYPTKESWRQSRTIKNDFHLFVLMLFSSDKGHGKSFLEILVALLLDEIWLEGNRKHMADQYIAEDEDFVSGRLLNESGDTFPSAMVSWIGKGLEDNNNERFELGLQLFCGSRGATPLLANCCQKFVALDFNCFFNPYYKKRSIKERDEDLAQDQKVGKRGRFKGHRPQAEPEHLYRDDMHGTQIYCIPENLMTSSEAEVIMLTEPLKFSPGSIRAKAKYDLVIVTLLEMGEADRGHVGETPRITAASNFFVERKKKQRCFAFALAAKKSFQH